MPFNRIVRAAVVAAALLSASAVPAFAGQAETRLLHDFAGTYTGAGKLTGGQSGAVRCRLNIKPAGEGVNFSGRCTFGAVGTESFSGVIRYNDARGRYESIASNGQAVVGRRGGGGIVFNSTMQDRRGKATSTMTLARGAVSIAFNLVETKTGEASKGTINFSRS
jgi:hypothetical protein